MNFMHVLGAHKVPRVVLHFYLQDQDEGAILEHQDT
jgi:hypothetical protein